MLSLSAEKYTVVPEFSGGVQKSEPAQQLSTPAPLSAACSEPPSGMEVVGECLGDKRKREADDDDNGEVRVIPRSPLAVESSLSAGTTVAPPAIGDTASPSAQPAPAQLSPQRPDF